MHVRLTQNAVILICLLLPWRGVEAQSVAPPQEQSAESLPQLSIEAKLDPRDTPGSVYQAPVAAQLPSQLAVEGFCLVSLRDNRQWVEGNPEARAVFGNKLYLFADLRKRDIFLANPLRYLPVLEGDCLVSYTESGERIPGQIEFGLRFRDRLFFFADEEKLKQFEQESDKFLTADLVESGLCIVSKIDEHRMVAGIPETVAVLNGLRYFFASAHHRKVFASNPLRYGATVDATLTIARSGGAAPSSKISSQVVAKGEEKSTDAGAQDSENGYKVSSRPIMSGYCPVSIRTRGIWIRGKAKFRTAYDGKTYNLAGAEELTLFQQDPLTYVPILGGDSVVAYVDQLVRKEGSVHHVGYYGERLYLFVNSEEKSAFEANPEYYANADLAFGGHCMVTQQDEKKQVLGLPEFETVYHGLRYRFASEENLKRFLADPTKFALR